MRLRNPFASEPAILKPLRKEPRITSYTVTDINLTTDELSMIGDQKVTFFVGDTKVIFDESDLDISAADLAMGQTARTSDGYTVSY